MSFVIWKICACYSFKYFFCNFLSSPYGNTIKHVTLLYKYIVLGYSVGFLFLFSFSLLFTLGSFYSHSSSSLILSLAMFIPLISHKKHYSLFIIVTVFYISSILINFLRVYLSG